MPVCEADFEYVRALVCRQAAIELGPDKAYRVEQSLLVVAQAEGCESVADLVARLRSAPANGLHRRVVEAMTVNETTFFRDSYPFEALAREIVPRLIAERGAAGRLDIWCAACSTGQEPYSVAMLLRDRFPSLAKWTVRVFATDLSEAVLERARRGVYSQLEVNRGLPAKYLAKHFQRDGPNWQLDADIRSAVEFRPLNLIEPWPSISGFDVVFLRNVLIYFGTHAKRDILARAHGSLRPGGALFLGGAETTLQLSESFERMPFERHSYYRRAGA